MHVKALFMTTAVLAALSLSACSSRFDTPFDMTSTSTFENANYKAADMLAGQSLNVVGRDTPLAVGTLSDINNIESSSALGRMIGEQVGARFVQLGYSVSEVKLRNDINVQQINGGGPAGGEYMLSRDRASLAGHTNARAVITGTYAVAGDNVMVNLRMVDVNNAQVLAAYDYTLPMNSDIRKLTETNSGQTGFFSTGWAK